METLNPGDSFLAREAALGTEIVDMNNEGAICYRGGTREAIATFALAGCTGLAVILNHPENPIRNIGIIAHYDPMVIYHRHYIEGFQNLIAKLEKKGMTAQAFILKPGVEDSTSPTGYAPRREDVYDIEERRDLEELVKRELGENTSVDVLGYKANPLDPDTEIGTILIEFTDDNNDPVRFFVAGRRLYF